MVATMMQIYTDLPAVYTSIGTSLGASDSAECRCHTREALRAFRLAHQLEKLPLEVGSQNVVFQLVSVKSLVILSVGNLEDGERKTKEVARVHFAGN